MRLRNRWCSRAAVGRRRHAQSSPTCGRRAAASVQAVSSAPLARRESTSRAIVAWWRRTTDPSSPSTRQMRRSSRERVQNEKSTYPKSLQALRATRPTSCAAWHILVSLALRPRLSAGLPLSPGASPRDRAVLWVSRMIVLARRPRATGRHDRCFTRIWRAHRALNARNITSIFTVARETLLIAHLEKCSDDRRARCALKGWGWSPRHSRWAEMSRGDP